MTGTPWLTYEGDIVQFHTTIKGKTDASLPPLEYRSGRPFDSGIDIMFGYSANHWVSKETMQDQLVAIEEYRRKTVAAKGLPEDSKMLILWDVYCRHRDEDLKEFMSQHMPNIIVIYIPANLTEICQPLDRYFNALLKTKMYNL